MLAFEVFSIFIFFIYGTIGAMFCYIHVLLKLQNEKYFYIENVYIEPIVFCSEYRYELECMLVNVHVFSTSKIIIMKISYFLQVLFGLILLFFLFEIYKIIPDLLDLPRRVGKMETLLPL